MNTLILGLTGFTSICLIAIFFILVIIIYQTLKNVSFSDNRGANFLISVCVTFLSIIGMLKFFTHRDSIEIASNVNEDGVFNFLLLPYAVLGITIIIVLLLKFILGASEKYGSRRSNKEYTNDAGKKHVSENKAKSWKNTDEESRIRK